LELPHHCPLPPLIASSPVNHGSRITSTDFCNKIGPSLPLRMVKRKSVVEGKPDLPQILRNRRV
ncbi:MAG: hypothetical protein ABSA68_19015, partial [Xanthobacteraceae bacterium]